MSLPSVSMAGMLGGIGFTMSLFLIEQSLTGSMTKSAAKLAILTGSMFAATVAGGALSPLPPPPSGSFLSFFFLFFSLFFFFDSPFCFTIFPLFVLTERRIQPLWLPAVMASVLPAQKHQSKVQ